MRLCILVSIVCHLFFALPAVAEEPLKIAIDVPYPPFTYYDEQGALTGFDVGIGNALCATMKRKCVYINIPFDGIILALINGEADFAIVGMGKTPEREKLVDFSDRYFRSQSFFIEVPGTVKGITVADLRGKRIGVQRGTVQEVYARQELPGATTFSFTKYEEVAEALLAGKVDVFLTDSLSGYELLKSPKGSSLEPVGEALLAGDITGISYITLPKGRDQLRKDINAAIEAIRNNGEYSKVSRKYFDFDVY